MTPHTDTDTRHVGRSGARVAGARVPETTTAAAPASSWDQRRAAVSWSHVLPLAVLLAFVNGFWIVVMRGAVGAIERTSAPFSTWWHESSLLLPVYVVAVLAAFMLAQRWFGPRPRGLRALSASIATVAVAASAAGTLLLIMSSWFDYRLQRGDLVHMSAAHPGCNSSCLSARIQATVGLELKAVWVGLLLMLVTDLVLAGLLLAFRGGVLVLARPPRPAPRRRVEDARLVLAAALVGAALVNVAVVPQHLDRSTPIAMLLLALALAQGAAALAVVAARTRVSGLLIAAVVSAAPLLLWAVAKTTGVPFVHETAKLHTTSVAGFVAGLLELVALAVAMTLLLRRRTAVAWDRHARAIAVTAVLAGTLVGIGGSTLPAVGTFSSLDDPARLHIVAPLG